jgi:hypothetical protein
MIVRSRIVTEGPDLQEALRKWDSQSRRDGFLEEVTVQIPRDGSPSTGDYRDREVVILERVEEYVRPRGYRLYGTQEPIEANLRHRFLRFPVMIGDFSILGTASEAAAAGRILWIEGIPYDWDIDHSLSLVVPAGRVAEALAVLRGRVRFREWVVPIVRDDDR